MEYSILLNIFQSTIPAGVRGLEKSESWKSYNYIFQFNYWLTAGSEIIQEPDPLMLVILRFPFFKTIIFQRNYHFSYIQYSFLNHFGGPLGPKLGSFWSAFGARFGVLFEWTFWDSNWVKHKGNQWFWSFSGTRSCSFWGSILGSFVVPIWGHSGSHLGSILVLFRRHAPSSDFVYKSIQHFSQQLIFQSNSGWPGGLEKTAPGIH